MDLNSKDTNELEDILSDELVGCNPGNFHVSASTNIHKDENIKRWINWMFKSDEVKKKFREEHQEIFFNISAGSVRPASWLDYYKGVLIKEIRDVKLKKLIK